MDKANELLTMSFPRMRLLLILLLITGVAGCASPGFVPVTDGLRPKPVYQGHHRVKKGETLYSIAWRYGRDYQQLARRNNIKPPYRIYPGQMIHLSRSVKTGSVQTIKKVNGNKTSKARRTDHSRLLWHWPVQGRLAKTFSLDPPVNQGINIAGPYGAPVKAAAAGQVVYAGHGLISYGNLLIVKHNKSYLSAYGHNSRILVKEGDRVRAGQKIAEIGSSGANKPVLNFQIRRQGKPVYPLKYLPER
jgi:lipoprotein NlpD